MTRRALGIGILLLLVAACEPRAASAEGEGFTVGSKAFTESVIIAEIAAGLVQGAGVDTRHRKALGGSRVVWNALLTGQIDAYPEYTGTLLTEIFPEVSIQDETALRAALAARGIGAPPAIVALFLYSLLPIVRNTATGLHEIPPPLRESAEALGLTPFTRLRIIELPMALPTILAGIKTSAVINVGTATLGALIGAGGYGQPILTGIRLDDIGLIMLGAVPAALLALAIQALFEVAERYLVPRGLRR